MEPRNGQKKRAKTSPDRMMLLLGHKASSILLYGLFLEKFASIPLVFSLASQLTAPHSNANDGFAMDHWSHVTITHA